MKRKTLYLLCGIPGSGKSYWSKTVKDAVVVSRDEIRFSLLSDGEDYFSHEDEVFDIFIKNIKKALEENDLVVADATHITKKSRNKTLDCLNLKNVDVIPVCFKVPLETIFKRNEQRTGRALVPRSVIRRFYSQFDPPTKNEKHNYKQIIVIKE